MPGNTQPHHYGLVRVQSEANVLPRQSQLGVKPVRLSKSLYKKSNTQSSKPGGDGRVIVTQRLTKKAEIDPEKKKKFDWRIKVRVSLAYFCWNIMKTKTKTE